MRTEGFWNFGWGVIWRGRIDKPISAHYFFSWSENWLSMRTEDFDLRRRINQANQRSVFFFSNLISLTSYFVDLIEDKWDCRSQDDPKKVSETILQLYVDFPGNISHNWCEIAVLFQSLKSWNSFLVFIAVGSNYYLIHCQRPLILLTSMQNNAYSFAKRLSMCHD